MYRSLTVFLKQNTSILWSVSIVRASGRMRWRMWIMRSFLGGKTEQESVSVARTKT